MDYKVINPNEFFMGHGGLAGAGVEAGSVGAYHHAMELPAAASALNSMHEHVLASGNSGPLRSGPGPTTAASYPNDLYYAAAMSARGNAPLPGLNPTAYFHHHPGYFEGSRIISQQHQHLLQQQRAAQAASGIRPPHQSLQNNTNNNNNHQSINANDSNDRIRSNAPPNQRPRHNPPRGNYDGPNDSALSENDKDPDAILQLLSKDVPSAVTAPAAREEAPAASIDEDDELNSDLDDDDEDYIIGAAAKGSTGNSRSHQPDDNDSESATAILDENVVLCQFEKVTRTKNKWRCMFKSGLIHVNGKDYLFSKANGEFEW